MKTKQIGHRTLCNRLRNECGPGQWVVFTAVTIPEMISPWKGKFIKVSVVYVQLKCNYQRTVNARRVREGKRPNFVSNPIPWGEWFDNHLLIRKDDNLYLRVHVVRTKEWYFRQGKLIPFKRIKLFLKKKKKSSRQRLANPVKVRTYGLSTIKRISFGGNRYIVRGK